MMNRRQFLSRAGVALGCFGLFSYAVAQVMNINDAINKAGRQRMLSQRMAKAYLQLGLAVDVEHSKKILQASLALFDKQFLELRAFAPTAENRQTLINMEKVWLSYKQVLSGKTPNRQDAVEVMLMNEEILTMAHAATVQLEKYDGNPTGQLVNIAGRQRMLSQRMAKFYQALQWGVAPADAQAKLELSRQEFIAGMRTLNASAKNTPRIKDELALAQQQWLFFDGALRQSGDSKNHQQYANNVATSSERILEIMDSITGLYQQLA